MIKERCYCQDITSYNSDIEKLEAAKEGIGTIETQHSDIQAGLEQIKSKTMSACNVDMAGFSSHTFISRVLEADSEGKTQVGDKESSVQSSIDTFTSKDKTYHNSVREAYKESK